MTHRDHSTGWTVRGGRSYRSLDCGLWANSAPRVPRTAQINGNILPYRCNVGAYGPGAPVASSVDNGVPNSCTRAVEEEEGYKYS